MDSYNIPSDLPQLKNSKDQDSFPTDPDLDYFIDKKDNQSETSKFSLKSTVVFPIILKSFGIFASKFLFLSIL